jgi:hypothetical protein
MNTNISRELKITCLKGHTTAGTATLTSSEVDMEGYEGVIFLTVYSVANANNFVTMHGGAATGVLAATVALKATGASDEKVVLDVFRPIHRFNALVCSVGTSSTVESIWAIQYGARTKDVTSALTGTLAHATFISPALA